MYLCMCFTHVPSYLYIVFSSGPIALLCQCNQVLGKWKFLQEKFTFLSPAHTFHSNTNLIIVVYSFLCILTMVISSCGYPRVYIQLIRSIQWWRTWLSYNWTIVIASDLNVNVLNIPEHENWQSIRNQSAVDCRR